MAYRKIPMTRSKLIKAYYRYGYRQPLRHVAEEMGVSHNTVRNWLIAFNLYESQCPNRGKSNVKHK